MSDLQHITYGVRDGVATLTMNRPEALNGMTERMLRETYETLVAASADPSVRVLVLTGAGDRSFCPGADLKWATSGGPREPGDSATQVCYSVAVVLHEMPALTIAAVNGACAGAGMGWALGADVRVAARSAVFRTAFLNVGVAGDMGIPWSLPRLIGQARARELSFFCDKFSADEARAYGLVARVWDDAVFRQEVDALVQGLSAGSVCASHHEGALQRRREHELPGLRRPGD
jgi:2-(1,2-epoxy-1,2-dihydrophenyl)acetyl-CoA isomerase